MRGYMGISLLGKDETWYRLPDTAMAQIDPAIIAKYLPAQAAAAATNEARGDEAAGGDEEESVPLPAPAR